MDRMVESAQEARTTGIVKDDLFDSLLYSIWIMGLFLNFLLDMKWAVEAIDKQVVYGYLHDLWIGLAIVAVTSIPLELCRRTRTAGR